MIENVTVLSTEGDARMSESGRNRREASPDLSGIADVISLMGVKTPRYP